MNQVINTVFCIKGNTKTLTKEDTRVQMKHRTDIKRYV